jgi:hypothetical protein
MRQLINKLINFVIALQNHNSFAVLNCNHNNLRYVTNVNVPMAYFKGACDFYDKSVTPGYFKLNSTKSVMVKDDSNILVFNIKGVYDLIDVRLLVKYCKANDTSYLNLQLIDYYKYAPDGNLVKISSVTRVVLDEIDNIWNHSYNFKYQQKEAIENVLKLF